MTERLFLTSDQPATKLSGHYWTTRGYHGRDRVDAATALAADCKAKQRLVHSMPAFTPASSDECALRASFDQFAPGVAYVDVEDRQGDRHIGSCFHIGDYIFITARHVVENRRILKIATTNAGVRSSGSGYVATFTAAEARTDRRTILPRETRI